MTQIFFFSLDTCVHFERSQNLASSSLEENDLDEISQSISSVTKYSGLRELSQFTYSNLHGGSNIISSIEFDRDQRYFACAGVSKKVKVYDLDQVLDGNNRGFHFPIYEISTPAKMRYRSLSNKQTTPNKLTNKQKITKITQVSNCTYLSLLSNSTLIGSVVVQLYFLELVHCIAPGWQ
jgi:WD40 repeat protein